jgi:hypothetical protein
MKRMRITGMCLAAVCAAGALAASTASAETEYPLTGIPEIGRCVNVGSGGLWTDHRCLYKSTNGKGAWEWKPGPGEKPKFAFAAIGEVEVETVSKVKVKCGPSDLTGEWTGGKTATVNVEFRGCLQHTTSKPCQTNPSNSSLIANEQPLEGELGLIARTNPPKVGLDLRAKSPSTVMLAFICGESSEGERWTVEGSVIGRIKRVDRLAEIKTELFYKATAGKQVFEHFESGVKDTLLATRTVLPEQPKSEQAGLTLKTEPGHYSILGKNEEPLEIKGL